MDRKKISEETITPAQYAPLYPEDYVTEIIEPISEEELEQRIKQDMNEKKHNGFRDIAETIIYCIAVTLLTILFLKFVIQPIEVIGASMNETLDNEDVVLVEKLSYRFGEIDRFDIVVFEPYEDKEETYVKRIIGLPGEVVYIDADGAIHIADSYENGKYDNDQILEEDYGKETIQYVNAIQYGTKDNPAVLGEDEYYVLGDNRNNSTDSRCESVGAVSKKQIDGRVVLRIMPFSEFGSVE